MNIKEAFDQFWQKEVRKKKAKEFPPFSKLSYFFREGQLYKVDLSKIEAGTVILVTPEGFYLSANVSWLSRSAILSEVSLVSNVDLSKISEENAVVVSFCEDTEID